MTAESWEDHCRKAVETFLVSAVIIDNEPVLRTSSRLELEKGAQPLVASAAPEEEDFAGVANKGADSSHDSPKGVAARALIESPPHVNEPSTVEAAEEESEEASTIKSEVNIQVAADAFADVGISCSFLLPDDEDRDEEAIKQRALKMADHSDLVVIDWYLKGTSANLTRQILAELIRRDQQQNGRLRLICIYTNQTMISDIIAECWGAFPKLGDQAQKDMQKGEITADNFHLFVCSKGDVSVGALPKKLIDVFMKFADGLLPAFALMSVAAIRRNVHHIITQFAKDLDPAYVANRLISDPPGDVVSELMRDLFASECDSALGLERVADKCLESETIRLWIDSRKQPLRKDVSYLLPQKKGTTFTDIGYLQELVDGAKRDKKTTVPNKLIIPKQESRQVIDQQFLLALLRGNRENDKISMSDNGDSPVAFQEKDRACISQSLHIENDVEKATERKFARLVALKREAFGLSKLVTDTDWKPSLTLGSLLAELDGDRITKYLYCLTPACDTVRLQGKVKAFLFLELVDDKKNTTLVVMSQDQKNELKLRGDFKPENIEKFSFKSDTTLGRVRAENPEDRKFIFIEHGGSKKFLWLGEARRLRAQRDLADLTKQWMRFGINDSEYLRICQRGKAKL